MQLQLLLLFISLLALAAWLEMEPNHASYKTSVDLKFIDQNGQPADVPCESCRVTERIQPFLVTKHYSIYLTLIAQELKNHDLKMPVKVKKEWYYD